MSTEKMRCQDGCGQGRRRGRENAEKERTFHKKFHNVEKQIDNFTAKRASLPLRNRAKCAIINGMEQDMPDLAGLLRCIREEHGETFSAFRALLLRSNETCNLTAVVEEREMLYKHFLDSAAGEGFFPQNASVAEVGSGAGFPSIPLKILRDDLSFTLFESVGKKCAFLERAVRELGLSRMTVEKLRAEDAARGKFREKYDVCCARAVARMNTLAEYCLPLVKVGGRFLAYKGEAEEELEEARRAIRLLGGRVEKICRFSLPDGYGKRTIAVIEKISPTPEKYPRGRGRERSAPLV